MFAGNFPPVGWAFCEGQPMPISENDVLFQLIGTTYGGDGEETFNLPNLSSRFPMHMGTGPDGTTYQIGEMAGTEQETLTTQQIPNHTHPFGAVDAQPGNQVVPTNNVPAMSLNVVPFINDAQSGLFNAGSVQPAGGSQPHENMQPYLCINFIISLYGIFPSQT
ncbi:phage tail protein [Nocardioides sp. MH1]|uniref:phage tail protein n=1 Tax=Nocardioides sp. MH1 TaxID=3242490 RepID=UPI003520358E